ncbi:MAG: transglycosylase SLT domain-containing protein [Paludibacteraceae bacterium]
MQKSNFFIFLFFLFLISGCKKNLDNNTRLSRTAGTFPEDTLRIVTQYGATSYFLYSDEEMGYDYEMAKNLAAYLQLALQVTVANTDEEMIDMVRTGKMDIAAYNTFETKKLKNEFNFVFPQQESYLVVVQNTGRKAISDPVELNGKEVWVKRNSIQHQRLSSLNDEIGGGINIKFADDSLTTDDLIQLVSDKKIKYTISYRHKALLQKSFNNSLDCRIPIGFNQQNGWLVRKDNQALTDTIQTWLTQNATKRFAGQLYSKYWERNLYLSSRKIHIPRGAISPYDHLFRKYAPRIGWDWRLLAAVAYAESQFDHRATSWAGARGIMQLMPQTGREFGLGQENFTDPESNIAAGVEYIKSLNMIYRGIEDREERIKFILASYNSGPAHILDAMALAEKYGKNKHIYYNNVEYYSSKKKQSAILQRSGV